MPTHRGSRGPLEPVLPVSGSSKMPKRGSAPACAWRTQYDRAALRRLESKPALVGALLWGGCSEAPAEPSLPELEPTEVHFRLGLDEPDRATGRLIGWNVGRGTLYAPAGDTIHPEWRTPQRQAAFAALAQIRSPHQKPFVRFSGLQIDGLLGGDGYHFWEFVRPDRPVDDDDNMGAWQWMAIVDEVDAEPLTMLNFGSGTADEAARYVDHLAGTGSPEAMARATWGHPEPYPTRIYELGNEIYGEWNTGYHDDGNYSYANPDAQHGGDPDWHGRPASDAADYAARALTYIEAVRAVDPDAVFWVPFSQASMDAWGGVEAAVADLEPLLLDPRVEAVVVHHYQVDDASVLGAPDMAAPELALVGPELFAPQYNDLRQRLDALARDEPLQIAVTEYHVAGAFTFGAFDDRADTPLVGLGVGAMLIGFAELGIDEAAQHMAIAFAGSADQELLFEPWYNPLKEVQGEVIPRPSYAATKLFAEHMLENTVVPEVLDVPTRSYASAGYGFDYEVVQAIAFVAGDAATVVLLNRDLQSDHAVTLDTPPGQRWTVAAVQAYAPRAWDEPVGSMPATARSLPVETVELGADRMQLDVPRHALLAVRLTSAP